MRFVSAVLFTLAVFAAGCRSESAADGAASTGDTFEIAAGDDMRFSLDAFTVAAGDSITVTLRNTGALPKETFGHNFVLLQQSADVAAFTSAAAGARDTDFIPAARASDIVAYTRLLGPNESETITFAAPSAPGTYTFVCTFPGHSAMMRGTMTVQAAG